MSTFFVELEVDEKWLKALQDFTSDIYDKETCTWLRIEEGNNE
jgi:hypothetical protein